MDLESVQNRNHRAQTISHTTAYALLVLIGMGYLFPLASIVQAYDAWVHLFPTRNVEFVLSAVYMGTNLAMVLLLTFVPVKSFRRRILQGFVGQLLGLLFIPTLLFFDISEPILFSLMLASTAFEAIVTGLLDSSLLAYCAQFPDTFSHGVEFGIGLSYFVSCVYRIITKVALSNSPEVSTIVYFYAGACTILSCVISFQYLDTQVGRQEIVAPAASSQKEPSRKESQLQLEPSIMQEQSSKESLEITLTPTNLRSTPFVPPSPAISTVPSTLAITATPDLHPKMSMSSVSSVPPHHSSTASSGSHTAFGIDPPSQLPVLPETEPTLLSEPSESRSVAITNLPPVQGSNPDDSMLPKTPRMNNLEHRKPSFVDSSIPRARNGSIKSISWKGQLMVVEHLLRQYYVVLVVFFVNGCLMPGMIASIPSSQSPDLESNGWFALSLLSTFAATDLLGRFCARYEDRMRCIVNPNKLWLTATIRNFVVVPPMILCVFKLGFTHDFWAYFWTAIFGFTNGVLNVTCITSVFQRCDYLLFAPEEKHFSGRMLSFVILLGLTSGAECGLGLSYLL